jgi:hypothetical protein
MFTTNDEISNFPEVYEGITANIYVKRNLTLVVHRYAGIVFPSGVAKLRFTNINQ